MAVDPEVADDVLVGLRGVDLLVMRLVEGWIHVHEITDLAAHDTHVIFFEFERLVGAAAGRARAPRQQLVARRRNRGVRGLSTAHPR